MDEISNLEAFVYSFNLLDYMAVVTHTASLQTSDHNGEGSRQLLAGPSPAVILLCRPILPRSQHRQSHAAQPLHETGEGADVVFEVAGETFAAHRWLLAS
jgi:hypothetical protein